MRESRDVDRAVGEDGDERTRRATPRAVGDRRTALTLVPFAPFVTLVALAALSAPEARALPDVRMTPTGDHVVQSGGRFEVPAGQLIDWSIELCNDTGAELGARFEDAVHGGDCFEHDPLRVICPPPGLGGGVLVECGDQDFGTVTVDDVPVAPGTCAQVVVRTEVDLLTPPGTDVANIAFYFTDVESGQTVPPNGGGCSAVRVVDALPTELSLTLTAMRETVPFASGPNGGGLLVVVEGQNLTPREARGDFVLPLPPEVDFVETLTCPDGASCSFDGTAFRADDVRVARDGSFSAQLRLATTCGAVGAEAACLQGSFVPVENPAAPIATDADLSTAEAEATCTPLAHENLVLVKTYVHGDMDGDGALSAGDTVRYEITAWNRGFASASDVEVSDGLPLGFQPTGISVDSAGTYDEASRTASWLIPSLDAGGVVEMWMEAEMGGSSVACNRARASTAVTRACGLPEINSDDPLTAIAGDCTRVQDGGTVLPHVTKDLLFEDADGDGLPAVGEPLTFEIVVENRGTAALTGGEIVDPLGDCWSDAADVVIEPSDGGIDGSTAREIRVSGLGGADGLAPGERVRVTFTTSSSMDVCCNAAQLTWDSGAVMIASDDPRTAITAPDATCTRPAEPALRLIKEALPFDENGDGMPQVGETVLWRVVVENESELGVDGAVLSDALPAGTTLVPGSVLLDASGASGVAVFQEPPAGRHEAGLLEARDLSLAPGGRAELLFETALEAEGVACNRASLLVPGQLAPLLSEDVAGDGPSCLDVTVIPAPTFELTSSSSGELLVACALPGEEVEVSASLVVGGTAPASDSQISFALQGAWDVIDAGGGSVEASRVVFSLGTVSPGETIERAVRIAQPCDAAAGVAASVELTASSPDLDADVTSPGPAVTVAVPRLEGMLTSELDDLDGDAELDPGEIATLRLRLEEVGGCALADGAASVTIDPALDVVQVLDGGVASPGLVEWTAAGTPGLASLAAGAATEVRVEVKLSADAENCAMTSLEPGASWPRAPGTACPDQAGWDGAAIDGPLGDCVTAVVVDLLRADDVVSLSPLSPALDGVLDATGVADTCVSGEPRIDPSAVAEAGVSTRLAAGIVLAGEALPGAVSPLVFYEVAPSCATIHACKRDADGDPTNGAEAVVVTTGSCVP